MSPTKYKPRPLVHGYCLDCGKPIQGTPRKLYCNDVCQRRAFRKRMKEKALRE